MLSYMGGARRLVHVRTYFWCHDTSFDVMMRVLTSFSTKCQCRNQTFLDQKCRYFSVKLQNNTHLSLNAADEGSVCKKKNPQWLFGANWKLWITVRHHSASLVMLNSYPHDGIFNPHLKTIKDSYMVLRITLKTILNALEWEQAQTTLLQNTNAAL